MLKAEALFEAGFVLTKNIFQISLEENDQYLKYRSRSRVGQEAKPEDQTLLATFFLTCTPVSSSISFPNLVTMLMLNK